MSQVPFDAPRLYAAIKRAIGAGITPSLAEWSGPDGDDVVIRSGASVVDGTRVDTTHHEFRLATGTGEHERLAVTLQPNNSVMYQRFAGDDGEKGLIAYWGADGSDALGEFAAVDVGVLHRVIDGLMQQPVRPPIAAPDRPRWSEPLQVTEDDDECTHVAVGTWGGRLFLIVEDVAGDNNYWRTELLELIPGVAGHTWQELWSHTWDADSEWCADFQLAVRTAIVRDTAGFLAILPPDANRLPHARAIVEEWLRAASGEPCLFADNPEECKNDSDDEEELDDEDGGGL